jgi:outer membrane protein TolC
VNKEFKKVMKNRFLVFLFMNVLLYPVFTESIDVNINQAMELLHRNNLHIKRLKLDMQMSERNKNTSWNRLLPPLNIRTNSTFLENPLYSPWDSSKTIEEPYGPDDHRFNFELGLETGLELNFSLGTEIESNALKYDAVILSYELSVIGLEYSVKKIFYSLLNLSTQIAIQEQRTDIEKQRFDLLNASYQNGLISDMDLLRGKISYESQISAYSNLQTQYTSLMLDLKLMLGLKIDSDIVLTGTLNPDLYTLNPYDLIRNHLGKSLAIRSLSTNVQLLENQKKLISQLAYTPRVSLGYSFTALSYNPWAKDYSPVEGETWRIEELGGIGNGLLTIKLSLSLDNFLPGSKVDVEIKNLIDQIQQLEITLQQEVRQTGAEIILITSKMENSLEQIRNNTLYESLTSKVYEMTKREYKTGTVELIVLLNARNEFLRAQSRVLDEQTTYLLTLFDLEYKLNTPIEKISEY